MTILSLVAGIGNIDPRGICCRLAQKEQIIFKAKKYLCEGDFLQWQQPRLYHEADWR